MKSQLGGLGLRASTLVHIHMADLIFQNDPHYGRELSEHCRTYHQVMAKLVMALAWNYSGLQVKNKNKHTNIRFYENKNKIPRQKLKFILFC